MAHITADRVKDTSTTTGTGALALSGSAPTGYRTFSAVCSTNDTVWYAIAHQSAAEWEVGVGTYSASNEITRTTVLASSNANAAVNFSSGTKDVFITVPAAVPSGTIALAYTAKQSFSGSPSAAALSLKNALEPMTVSATAATGTINFDVTTQSILYYTTNASANWTLNVRGSAGTSLNTLMATGEAVTIAFLVTNGATPYYNSAVTIDGSANTPKWQGGSAPTAGNASSVDLYTYTIIKTGNAAFTVFAAVTRFA